jgi:hypothetical protein
MLFESHKNINILFIYKENDIVMFEMTKST